MQKIMMKQLREKGLDLSAAEIIEALESMKIQHVSDLKKASTVRTKLRMKLPIK